jgi:hypothetical protein
MPATAAARSVLRHRQVISEAVSDIVFTPDSCDSLTSVDDRTLFLHVDPLLPCHRYSQAFLWTNKMVMII